MDDATPQGPEPENGKRSLELSIDAALAKEAEAAGIDFAEALERVLKDETKAARWSRWRAENQAAIEVSNAELERNGLWCDAYRVW